LARSWRIACYNRLFNRHLEAPSLPTTIRHRNAAGRVYLEMVTGDTRGRWDSRRLQQLLRNLVSNGIIHGAPDTSVRVVLTGEEDDVCFEVTNSGPTIERSALDQIFDPLMRGCSEGGSPKNESGLGLGLFIVREVARAHGGEVGLRSDRGETVFAVRLPRRNPNVNLNPMTI